MLTTAKCGFTITILVGLNIALEDKRQRLVFCIVWQDTGASIRRKA